MKFKLTLILTSTIFLSSFAQQVTEGIVEYKVSYPISSEKINVKEMKIFFRLKLSLRGRFNDESKPVYCV